MIYNKWITLKVEYRSTYSKFLAPYIQITFDGMNVGNYYSPSGYTIHNPAYIRFGLYERNWISDGIGEDETRTIMIRNVIFCQ